MHRLLAAPLLQLVAVAAVLASNLSAAASAPDAPNGLPNCTTSCGDVTVPYPFGISAECSLPGFNLTCDRTYHPPRLLLGDGSFQVKNIFLHNATAQVISAAAVNLTSNSDTEANVTWGGFFDGGPYMLSRKHNEFVLVGCNVQATLLLHGTNEIVSACSSFCSVARRSNDAGDHTLTLVKESSCNKCSGTICCQAAIPVDGPSYDVHLKRLEGPINDGGDPQQTALVLIAESGWFNNVWERVVFAIMGKHPMAITPDLSAVPVVLEWAIGSAPPAHKGNSSCPKDVGSSACKSKHSSCDNLDTPNRRGYTCRCWDGYEGNPYLTDGCQDIDECALPDKCFGECTNTPGHYQCRCPRGAHGNPYVRHGCVKSSAASAPAAPIGLPNCTTSCGNVIVPYPFGISAQCSYPGFNLTCDRTYHPPRLLLGDGSFHVKNIFLHNATAQVISAAAVNLTSNSDTEANVTWGGFADGGPYMLSRKHNEFVLVGCNVQATLLLHGTNEIVSACSSFCLVGRRSNDAGDHTLMLVKESSCSKCSGNICCQAAIPVDGPSYDVHLKRLEGPINDGGDPQQTALVLIAERGWFNNVRERVVFAIMGKHPMAITPDLSAVPVVLEWAIRSAPPAHKGNSSCPKDVGSSACKSKHSSCDNLDTPNRRGYTCRCWDGYDGNPYLTDGCQDIDECALPDKCYGECTNTPGAFLCRCPRGARGNPYVRDGCVKSSAGLSIGLGVGSSVLVSFLVFGGIIVTRKLKAQRVKKTRQRFFVQNHGQLLSQRADIAERMIITLEELEKATNNFDKARELGRGGQGTVYKGILSDLHVVAIKKPNSGIQREIDEFINEVAILSQINHRNIVRLFGCCLETEVPLLVYEFISNGTLYDHLHVEGPRSLSWDDRLRISIETARAVAYLHSAASIPIIHRDIKSSNILLDDTLTAKVSDFGASKHVPMDQTGVTTVVQGTIGYLDPMYYCRGRLTEKSDVYSFGVFLVELLTRKKPFSYRTSEGNGLAAHFSVLFDEDNLVQILDPQVMEEGYKEAKVVAELAVACVKMKGEDRPTMRQVEMTLEGIPSSKQDEDNTVQVIFEGNFCSTPNGLLIEGGDDSDGLSQHYYTSLGEPFVLSPGYLEI